MLVNTANLQQVCIRALLGMTSISFQASTAVSSLFIQVAAELTTIKLDKANPHNDTDFENIINSGVANMKARLYQTMTTHCDSMDIPAGPPPSKDFKGVYEFISVCFLR